MLRAMFMKKLSYLSILIFSLLGLSFSHAVENDAYITDYAVLLSKHVKQSEKQGIQVSLVDYRSWGADPLHQKALASLKKTDPDRFSEKEKMAFWINASNFLTIDLIIKTKETDSIKNQGSLFKNVWKGHDWEIHGQRYIYPG